MDSDKLSAPERALWQAFPRGELVDLTKARGVRARSIRGEVISSLLLGNDAGAQQGHVPAIRIEGARITGPLDLANAGWTSWSAHPAGAGSGDLGHLPAPD